MLKKFQLIHDFCTGTHFNTYGFWILHTMRTRTGFRFSLQREICLTMQQKKARTEFSWFVLFRDTFVTALYSRILCETFSMACFIFHLCALKNLKKGDNLSDLKTRGKVGISEEHF